MGDFGLQAYQTGSKSWDFTVFTDVQLLQVDETPDGRGNVGHFIVTQAQLPDTMATE